MFMHRDIQSSISIRRSSTIRIGEGKARGALAGRAEHLPSSGIGRYARK